MTTKTTTGIDEAKAEAFAGKMMDVLNGAAVGLLTSVGHQTGLFDKMADLPPSTSEQIAAATGLNERYVREWLGSMVTSRILEYDRATQTYRLPPEHARFLTRAAGPDNMASFTPYIALCGNVEGKVIEAFRHGGGVPYSAYPDFQRLQAEETAALYDTALVNVTLPLVPGLIERLRAGIDVADIGCGAGHAINVMARAFPNSRFVGLDLSEEGIEAGRAEARAWGLQNATFEVRDVAALDERGRWELITAFDAIHDQAQPRRVLRNIAEALRPDGVFLMVDMKASSEVDGNVDLPLGPTLYMFSVFHCMTVSLAQGGEGLGTVWGEGKARELLAEAGFTDVEVKEVDGDILNSYYICRKA